MNRYTSQSSAGGTIDLRSDTVTRPSAGMREAMARAEVGDDVYGDDPTVIALEERAADLLGKEAGLFVATGTQSNLTALLTHCGRGDEYISGVGYHIPRYEAAGAAVLGGISPCHVQPDERGGLTASQIEAELRDDDPHFAISRLVCLENAHDGRVQDQGEIVRIGALARERGLSMHLDGARLLNAAVASGASARELAAPFDTVSLCLSKGLGSPVGSVLCGSADFVRRARRNRKLLGGGMRQAGVLAACGLYALAHHVEDIADDHARAARLAEGLSRLEGFVVDTARTETNMVWLQVGDGASFVAQMRESGIVIGGGAGTFRLVTHRDVSDANIDTVLEAAANYSRSRSAA